MIHLHKGDGYMRGKAKYLFMAIVMSICMLVGCSEVSQTTGDNVIKNETQSTVEVSNNVVSGDETVKEQESVTEESSEVVVAEAPAEEVTEETTEEVTEQAVIQQEAEAAAQQAEEKVQAVEEPAPVSNSGGSTMVWIPKSGKKYHSSSSCSNMKNPSQVTIEKAQSLGYTPCSKCY